MAKTKVLHVAAEVFPLVKTGGLADVIGALPEALIARGVDARLVLPGLPAIVDELAGSVRVAELGPAFGAVRATLRRGRIGTVTAYVIDAPWLYARPGNPYVGSDGREWPDNPERFAMLGWAGAHLAAGELGPWRPDIVHAHDWHAGLALAYLARHPLKQAATVFTIHNIAYQGLFDLARLPELMLPASVATPQGLEFHGQGSFMKAGLVWAERITTVSPRYAREIQTPEFGCGLEGLIATRADRLAGILNGVDYAVWNPASDAHLEHRYDRDALAGKAAGKAALQRQLGLDEAPHAPLFVIVSRLTGQKGMDLLEGALPRLVRAGGQLALLGSGDAAIERALLAVAGANPGRVAVRIGYDEPLAHRLIAAGDAILVPSRFEPCGLTQLYGLRYGTLPVVRRAGGLADTVRDAADPAAGTGFVFDAATPAALGEAIERAIAAYRAGDAWRALQQRAMAEDFSWSAAAARYVALYESLLPRPA